MRRTIVVAAIVVAVVVLASWLWYTRRGSTTTCIGDEPELRRAIARGPCLVFFYAPWCPVCPTAKEQFDRDVHHFRAHNPNVDVYTMDVSCMQPSTLQEFGIETVPHLLHIDHDKFTKVDDVKNHQC